MNTALARSCNVCGAALDRLLYRSPAGVSVTSLCEVWQGDTVVYGCDSCGHIQTDELLDIDAYYDHEYNILVGSEDEDQIYRVVSGKPVFRTDHQVMTLTSKVPLSPGARVLDYGCAKGASLRKLMALRPDIVPHLFDVSENYVDFWRTLTAPENWATYVPRKEWSRRFDLVTSFYAFEHMARPGEALQTIRRLLRPDGLFYGVVPNVFTNSADFIVADHVNHFTEASLARLLQATAFEVREIDAAAHDGAFVFVGCATAEPGAAVSVAEPSARQDPRIDQLAEYWRSIGVRIREFEAANLDVRRAAIYGSGFYGTFIATCLRDLSRIECFVDQNPHRQGKQLLDKPVLPPAEVPLALEIVYVGLNPRTARDSIAGVGAWSGRGYRYFYL